MTAPFLADHFLDTFVYRNSRFRCQDTEKGLPALYLKALRQLILPVRNGLTRVAARRS